ncbi:MAG: hypothetical protein QOJ13_2670, partial [Gaiellales bacterium]|nr:hypothetical protein [Gaiellales bacterium]
MADQQEIVIGVVAAEGETSLAKGLAEELPEILRDRLDAVDWCVEVQEVEPAEASTRSFELIERVRQSVLGEGWHLGIGLTALPLRDGRRPVASYASGSHGVAIISVPALGAVRRDERLLDMAVEAVNGLLGASQNGAAETNHKRMLRRSTDLASPDVETDPEHSGTVRFTSAVIGGNLRLLAGMIRANHPARVVARLSRSSAAALGTGAYAVTSSNIWTVAHDSEWPRLLAVALVSLALILFALVVAHGLWEGRREPAARERIVLFNVVTIVTLAIGVAALYLTLFVVIAT